MAKRKESASAKRLLEAWEPPQQAGEPIGCAATTFTFDPVFFEEHCLSRFLSLETDPREDGAAYLIEREEKLAVTKVAVFVDRSNMEGSQSPRWDVLPVTVPRGIFHPKISILGWHNWVRVIVGSGNLTEPAYRKNQEVFGCLDFCDEGEASVEILLEVLAFLEQIITLAIGTEEVPSPKSRLRSFLNQIRDQAQRWTGKPHKKSNWPRAGPVFLGPFDRFRQPVPERLGFLMRERGGPANAANVVSPFFDRTDHEVYPANEAVLAALTDRGYRELNLCVPKETLPGDKIRLRSPASVTRHGRKTADIRIYPVSEECDGEVRPLHTKSLWYWNDNWHVYMIGSSNFTSAGLGLAESAMNVEANLAYVFPENSKTVRMMEDTLPEWDEEVKDFTNVLWEPLTEEEGEDPTANPVLPVGFGEALFEPTDTGGVLKLSFGSNLPSSWHVSPEKETLILYSSEIWNPLQRTVELTWKFPSVPRALRVRWKTDAGPDLSALWPVNVSDTSRLPPPDALRNLSLETLVEILGSKLPLHEAVAAATRATNGPWAYDTDGLAAQLDPLRRYQSETFLLQRTRRVAKAIEQLITNLNRPVFHKDSLLWRLHGPVGPLALARALNGAATSPGEASFLLAELLLALQRIDVETISVGVEKSEVLGEIDQVKAEIRSMVQRSLASGDLPQSMSDYVSRVLTEAVL